MGLLPAVPLQPASKAGDSFFIDAVAYIAYVGFAVE